MTATFRSTSSAAAAGNRSYRPSTQRYSIATLRPSTYPLSASPSRNALRREAKSRGDSGPRYPITGIEGDCARAEPVHAAAPPIRVRTSRRLIRTAWARSPALIARGAMVPTAIPSSPWGSQEETDERHHRRRTCVTEPLLPARPRKRPLRLDWTGLRRPSRRQGVRRHIL